MASSSDDLIVATLLTNDAMESAKSLLSLGGLATDERQKSSAAASAVVAAIAHLTRATEMGLIASAANKAAAEGVAPTLGSAKKAIPFGLRARMQQLVIETFGPRVLLDDKKPMVRLLYEATQYRNRLVHHPGTYRIGTAKGLGASITGGYVTLRLPTPRKEWEEATLEYAGSVVEAVEEYLSVVLTAQPGEGSLDSRFVAKRAQRAMPHHGGREHASRGRY